MGLDATRTLPGEPGHDTPLPEDAPAPAPEALYTTLAGAHPNLVACHLPLPEARLHLALLVVDKQHPGEGALLAEAALAIEGVDVAVAVQGTVADDLRLLAWRALSSIDPGRDVRVLGRKVAVDATFKGPEEGHHRSWPAELHHPMPALEKAAATARDIGLIP